MKKKRNEECIGMYFNDISSKSNNLYFTSILFV